jgi:predicted protein tyrosine phosphatase
MFDLKVVGLDEANILRQENWPTRIVSLTGDEMLDYGPRHLHVTVDDVNYPTPHWLCPELSHLQQVLEFTKDLTTDDRLLVHCLAGISRSTSIAIGILIQHGMDYREAFERVETVRACLIPNRMFIQHIDDHFSLNGQLVALVAASRARMLFQVGLTVSAETDS